MNASVPAFGAPNADDREKTARGRDATAQTNDQTARARDDRSEARHRRAEAREFNAAAFDSEAAAGRAAARRDRQSSANDRLAALHDRTAAATDRRLAALERAALIADGLTGARLRLPGLAELERDIARAVRTDRPFVLAFVDVDGLKVLNDSAGHQAGDELLQNVVACLQASVREYDLIVRYGGDEFLCGITDLSLADAVERFQSTQAAFRAGGAGSYSVGLAQLLPLGDDLSSLIARADSAMYEQRRRRRDSSADS